jgi:hypothetical protein
MWELSRCFSASLKEIKTISRKSYFSLSCSTQQHGNWLLKITVLKKVLFLIFFSNVVSIIYFLLDKLNNSDSDLNLLIRLQIIKYNIKTYLTSSFNWIILRWALLVRFKLKKTFLKNLFLLNFFLQRPLLTKKCFVCWFLLDETQTQMSFKCFIWDRPAKKLSFIAQNEIFFFSFNMW